MKTGWYYDEYFVVKPLKNGCRQQLVMGVQSIGGGRWNVMMGIFPSNCTYKTMSRSSVWYTPTSTNKKPSINVLHLALEALDEIEQEIHNHVNGKRAYIYVDGLDERRLRVYTKVLTKKNNYKLSTVKNSCGLPLLYKRV